VQGYLSRQSLVFTAEKGTRRQGSPQLQHRQGWSLGSTSQHWESDFIAGDHVFKRKVSSNAQEEMLYKLQVGRKAKNVFPKHTQGLGKCCSPCPRVTRHKNSLLNNLTPSKTSLPLPSYAKRNTL